MIKYLLLGILRYLGPKSGYSMHRTIFEGARPTVAQVYRTLKDMTDEGLVTVERINQERRPARNVFTISPKGHAELERWMRERLQTAASAAREPIIQKMWFANMTNKETVEEHLVVFENQKKKEFAYYNDQAIVFGVGTELGSDGETNKIFWQLAFDYLKRRVTFEAEWAREARRVLVDLAPRRPGALRR